MKKIMITTNHPAPYMDKWFEVIEKKYELTVIYHYRRDPDKASKKWKGFTGYPGIFLEEISDSKMKSIILEQDMIITGGWTNQRILRMIVIGKIMQKKVAIFTDYPFHQHKLADLFKKVFLYRYVDFVFCATRSTEKFIQKKYRLKEQKTRFFPYAVDFPNLSEESHTADDSVIKVLIANNFIKRKGYEILFKALKEFSYMNKDVKDYEFHIAGHGPLMENCKQLATELKLNTFFYGWCEPEKYASLQKDTSFYIHASLEEPFGIPPLDAMARGKVVIVSNGVKSTDLLIENGFNGFIYEARDYKQLANILSILKSVNRKSIGEQAKKDVYATYSLERNIAAIASCFDE